MLKRDLVKALASARADFAAMTRAVDKQREVLSTCRYFINSAIYEFRGDAQRAVEVLQAIDKALEIDILEGVLQQRVTWIADFLEAPTAEQQKRCVWCGATAAQHDDIRDGVRGHEIRSDPSGRLTGTWHAFTEQT